MADLVYLSLWLRDFSESNMLQHWRRVIEAFPVSATSPGIRVVTIYPFHWGETPVFERSFGEGIEAGEIVNLAAEFLHEDYAYEVEMNWDLWFPGSSASSGGWNRTPAAVSVACLGPAFDREGSDDRADIQVNFGLDTPFLPAEQDALPELGPDFDPDLPDRRTRENLQQLVEFVHRLDQILPIAKRSLWCESGENLAEKILAVWNERI